MSFWRRLFPPRTIVVDEELADLAATKRQLEADIHELRINHSELMTMAQAEQTNLTQLRSCMATLRVEQADIEDSINFKKLNETIQHQTRCNARLAAALMDAEKRANDEACKRLSERHYNIRTAGG